MLREIESRGSHASSLQPGGDFGQTEVENFYLTSCGNKNVGRLDVAMNDSLGVCRVQCVGDLDAKIQQGFDFQRLGSNFVLQGNAFKVLHGDEGLLVLVIDLV